MSDNGYVKVYLSAAPGVRDVSLPPLVGGMVVELREGTTSTILEALDNDRGVERLVARDTGRVYGGLPWWEARDVDGWP